ncbi:MAG: hypothetical protein ACOCZU_06310 [Planctomycetota bacterium]
MTGYESESTGAKSIRDESGRERIELRSDWKVKVLGAILLVSGAVALVVGLVSGVPELFSDEIDVIKLVWACCMFLIAGGCTFAGLILLRGGLIADEVGLHNRLFGFRRLLVGWDDVAGFRYRTNDRALKLYTARGTIRRLLGSSSLPVVGIRRLWARARWSSGRRPIPRMSRTSGVAWGVVVGLVILAAAAVLWVVSEEKDGWVVNGGQGIIASIGLLVVVLSLRRWVRVWYATPDGLIGPGASRERFVSWEDIHTISLVSRDTLFRRIFEDDATDTESGRLVRVETRDRRFRLILTEDPGWRMERLLVRRARQAAVFVENTGDIFPPTSMTSLDMAEGLARRARAAARNRMLTAGGYFVGLLGTLAALAWLCKGFFEDELGASVSGLSFLLFTLAFGLAVWTWKSWKHARLLAARAGRIEDDFRDPARRAELLRARQRFGIRGLWAASPREQED